MSNVISPTIMQNQVFAFSNFRSIVVSWGRAEIESQMSIEREAVLANGNVILFFVCYGKKFEHYFVVLDSTQTKILDIGFRTLNGEVVKVWEQKEEGLLQHMQEHISHQASQAAQERVSSTHELNYDYQFHKKPAQAPGKLVTEVII